MAEKSTTTMWVNGEDIEVTIELIDIWQLSFWKENPRVYSIIKEHFGDHSQVSDENIEAKLWELESVKDLYKDVFENGGLIEEVLIRKGVVLEGNSRLCVYRRLHNKAAEVDKAKWAKIKAKVIPDYVDDEAILTILGSQHIKGKAAWRTFERTAYIYRMHRDYHKTPEQLVPIVKESATEIKALLETYKTMEEQDIDQGKYSAIYEIVKNSEMKKIRISEPDMFAVSIEAVKNNRFERAELVRSLPKVIGDKKARKAFFEDEEEFEDALEIAKARHPEHGDRYYKNIKKLTEIIKDTPVQKIDEIKNDNKKLYFIKELNKEVEKLCKKLGIR